MRSWAAGLAAFGVGASMGSTAQAGVAAVHVGVMDHNVCVTDCKNANKEGSPNIEIQLSFETPAFLSWAGSPQPYVMASANTAGDTSFAAVGLEWRLEIGDNWAIEPGIGYAIHDGELENPFPGGSPQAADFASRRLLHGSRDLFRTSLGLSRQLEGPWQAQLFFEHLSHGQIIGGGHNQGTDQFGVRLGYQFGH
ncbi:MAG: acyloxyacyl hydrolase [Hyphomonadaceae bacterium]